MRNFYLAVPLYLLVPVAAWRVFAHFGLPLQWSGLGVGALGWLVALQLRAPLSLLARRLPMDRAQRLVVASSGPLEEGVRLCALLLTGRSLDWAVSLGQGWAAIEVLFALVQGFAVASLLYREDEKAQQVKELLRSQGTLTEQSLWGVVERIFVTAFHIGSTLLISLSPWLALAMAPVHSGFNIVTLRVAKRSIARAMGFVALVGAGLLTLALLAGGV